MVIMSTTGWQESQEALKGLESTLSSGTRSSPNQGGVLKTEEFTVRHERRSFGDENSIALKPLGGDSGGDHGREQHPQAGPLQGRNGVYS